MSDKWLLKVRGNNTMISHINFGTFAGKTKYITSYKNPLTDQFLNPIGGAIYWYKVFVSGLNIMLSVLTMSFASTETCTSTGKQLKFKTFSHAICVQSLPKDIQTIQSYVVHVYAVFLATGLWGLSELLGVDVPTSYMDPYGPRLYH